MASANPACRLQTAIQVRLRGWSQTLCGVTPCTQNTLHPSDAWGGAAIICQLSQPSRAETDGKNSDGSLLSFSLMSHIFSRVLRRTIITLLFDNRFQHWSRKGNICSVVSLYRQDY